MSTPEPQFSPKNRTPQKKPEKGKRKSAAEELYRILRELVLSLPLGAPLPPVHLLKANYRVGYSLLNATLLRLEKEKQIVIKQRKGIFVVGSRNGEQESPPEPKEWDWIFMMPGRAGVPALPPSGHPRGG